MGRQCQGLKENILYLKERASNNASGRGSCQNNVDFTSGAQQNKILAQCQTI
jgi:hypothetical protein